MGVLSDFGNVHPERPIMYFRNNNQLLFRNNWLILIQGEPMKNLELWFDDRIQGFLN